jgi:hypothetical protein
MSEYTYGVLFLQEHADTMGTMLAQTQYDMPLVLRPLNAKWHVLFLEDDSCSMPDTEKMLLEVSHAMPLLRFFKGDEGWAYYIYSAGQCIASCYESHEIAYGIARSLGEERYPDDFWFYLSSERFTPLLEEVYNSPAYWAEVAEQFRIKNVLALALFDFDQSTIMQVDAVLTAEWRPLEGRPDYWMRVDAFKELLNMEEMTWQSYHYVTTRS